MKPANVILDLLRTYPARGTSARKIMAAGELFGLNDNLMRVTLSRLVQKGIIENFERGYYRLSNRTDPLSDFVEEWREGEARRIAWDENSWLLVHTSGKTADKRNWALQSTGFRMIQDSLWMRPDNLAIEHSTLEQRLSDLGTAHPFILVSGGYITDPWRREWMERIDVDSLTQQYVAAVRDLEESLARLPDLPRADAMIETFNVGGKAIQLLAKDPLLPDQIQDPATRIRLWELMLEYDKTGRSIWAGKDPNVPDSMPISQTRIA